MSKVEEVAAACRSAVEQAGKLERSVSFEEMSFFVARAAIEAMREPTEAMVDAGVLDAKADVSFFDVAEAYRSMISQALNEEG